MSNMSHPQGRPIIVIDDNPDDLLLLRHGLMKSGIANSIFPFEHPVEALEYLSICARSVDSSRAGMVVFCDLKMPGLDGFSVLQRIRADSALAAICVIIVSACALECDVERARELGANGYLEKIPSPEELRLSLGDRAQAEII